MFRAFSLLGAKLYIELCIEVFLNSASSQFCQTINSQIIIIIPFLIIIIILIMQVVQVDYDDNNDNDDDDALID